jgi:hypothetical protein
MERIMNKPSLARTTCLLVLVGLVASGFAKPALAQEGGPTDLAAVAAFFDAERTRIPDEYHLAGATVAVVASAVLAWIKRCWGVGSRVLYTLVALAGVAFVWWMTYWNVLG